MSKPRYVAFRKKLLFSLTLITAISAVFAGAAETSFPDSRSFASPEHPVGWRGDGSGHYPSAHPSTKWSESEHLRWRTEVGAGQSSPIVVGSRVLITAEPDLLLCLDANSGKELWRKTNRFSDLTDGPKDPGESTQPSQYGDMTPTPVSDGKLVWVFVGTGLVACYDLEGKRQWMNGFDLPRTTGYGRTASPVLVGERLLVHFGPLVCLHAPTGKLLWKNDDAKASYGTPAHARIRDSDVLITPKGDVVRVADGKILASSLGNCTYSSPVVHDNVVYFIEADASAVRLPDRMADQIQCPELWSQNLVGEFYASPLIDGQRIYAIDKAANYYVLDTKTGKTILNKTLEFSRTENVYAYPSLCLADNLLFIGNDAGEMLLLRPTDQATVIGTNSLPRGSGATPLFSGKRILVRGAKLLYCLEPP